MSDETLRKGCVMLRSKRASGFTLVETLAVIGLLALLMAMLFPVLARVKRPARGIICIEHLYSIGVGIALYAADADSRYPIGVDPADKFGQIGSLRKQGPLLADVLISYTKSREIWRCPMDDEVPPATPGSANESVEALLPDTRPSMVAKYGMSNGYDARLGGTPHLATMIDADG
ncbi:MAG: hypothetical protein C4320_00935 [Armatimonadota bacterium]